MLMRMVLKRVSDGLERLENATKKRSIRTYTKNFY